MKKPRSHSYNPHSRKVACTVSAAALMLGVSQAATVGLSFRVSYCGNHNYDGPLVSMTAFGVGPSAWENLSKMDTGYGCAGTGPYTLSQVVDTTTSTGGLNPLPNGSLSLTWSADTANFSGFAGYGGGYPGYSSYAGPPHYSYPGQEPPPFRTIPQPYPTGEWEVYDSFMRDGVNFGPQPGAGYSVDITGLKSLFTNTPFVVQLVAASDSMEYLTNAFIIDATLNSTQSVVYPSTPPVIDQGDQTWIRGSGGGLSTASGSLDTDHLKIIGNQAAHGGDKTAGTGYNFASTLTAAIITDKPVISMSPQQALVCRGDTVVWSGYGVGVPPLAYQWRKNGVAIPGATTSSYGVTNVGLADIGTYDLRVTNVYGVAVSSPVTIGDGVTTLRINNLVLDSNPNGPAHDGLNHGATWLASSTDGASVTRTGVMSFSASVPSQITVGGETNFNSGTGTIMFWMRSSGLANLAGKPATLFDRLNNSGCVVQQNADGTVEFEAASVGTAVGAVATTNILSDNRWHHFAVTFDQSTTGPLLGVMALYVDGQPDVFTTIGANWSWKAGQEIELGLSHDTSSYQPYNGLMDDVRYYNRGLSGSEIASAYGGALVDTSSLIMQLNFTTGPGAGITLTWGAPDGILQSADSVKGPYTDVPGAASPYSIGVQAAAKFYRYRHVPVVVIANPYLM